jgi:hypothetical protein
MLAWSNMSSEAVNADPTKSGGRTDIIGTGLGIVFEVPPDFFQGVQLGVRATWIVHSSRKSASLRDDVGPARGTVRGGEDRRNLAIHSVVEIREPCLILFDGSRTLQIIPQLQKSLFPPYDPTPASRLVRKPN